MVMWKTFQRTADLKSILIAKNYLNENFIENDYEGVFA